MRTVLAPLPGTMPLSPPLRHPQGVLSRPQVGSEACTLAVWELWTPWSVVFLLPNFIFKCLHFSPPPWG